MRRLHRLARWSVRFNIAADRDNRNPKKMQNVIFRTLTRIATAMTCMVLAASYAAAAQPANNIQHAVDEAIQPMMAKNRIPGVAVGVIVDGKVQVFNYGVTSLESR